MIIKILGAESLGVRGLSCVVELDNRKIIIDPGIALGFFRHGLFPHPFQIAVGAGIRKQIIMELKGATDIIISHFDGDHCPLYNPNPYQLGINDVEKSLSACRIWAKSQKNCSSTHQIRREKLVEAAKQLMRNAEGIKEGPIEFSFPVPHGQRENNNKSVIMSRIEENGTTFVHASDIQLLDHETIEIIINWKPDIVLASGPPLYLSSLSFESLSKAAWKNSLKLSEYVETLILDHHLLRFEGGITWLERLKSCAKNNVICAADFMERGALFLEAWRNKLFELLPVHDTWHKEYEQGRAGLEEYRARGWELLIREGKIKPCKWYPVCPIKTYTEEGRLDRYWIENYCLVNNRKCIRYRMEEKGEYHPDNMLPDGTIKEFS